MKRFGQLIGVKPERQKEYKKYHAAAPKTQKWWATMKPVQKPVEARPEGDWWATMEEVFHTD
jgi:L-rhamnose mutarotase